MGPLNKRVLRGSEAIQTAKRRQRISRLRDSAPKERGEKADGVFRPEGNTLGSIAKNLKLLRGPRAEHVYNGALQEPGRPVTLLA